MRSWTKVVLAAALGAIALSAGVLVGCGDSGPTVTLSVSREFDRVPMVEREEAPLEGHGTVLRLLREHADAKLSQFGSVSEVDGYAYRVERPNQRTWAINVNGIESDTYPAEYKLFPDDVVQLALRDWHVWLDVRATVGAFPETFSRGVFGRRFPVTVVCERPGSRPCRQVRQALRRAGVDPDGGDPPGPRPAELLPQRARILVGRWEHWRARARNVRMDEGPRYSGIFARFSPDGRELRLLDWNAHRVRAAGPGTGLVGAQRPTEEDLLWLVTGTDDVGVARAAAALDSPELHDMFAAAITADGPVALPLPPP